MSFLKYILVIVLYVLFIHDVEAQPYPTVSNLFGTWRVVNGFDVTRHRYYFDVDQSCIGQKIIFEKDRILSSAGCLYGIICDRPNYSASELSTKQAFDNDSDYARLVNYHRDSVVIVTTKCTDPLLESIVYLNKNKITVSSDNTVYILAKENNNYSIQLITINKCYLYNNSCESSITKGYLIKNDIVEIFRKQKEWCQIKYTSAKTGKSIIRWIKTKAIE